MSINYTVHAEVVDIGIDKPQQTDIFLVDTNVWYWLTYSNASLSVHQPPQRYQITNYPYYLKTSLEVGANILQCGLSLAELSHRIEKVEHEIYEKTNTEIQKKEYRHNLPEERAKVVSEVTAAWHQVSSMAQPLEINIDIESTTEALKRFKTEKNDGYDLFMLEAMKNNDVIQIITDDGDFASVPGIQVFTSNFRVLKAAKKQGRLIAR